MTSTVPLRVVDGLRYGLLGFPLAFCALPLYVLMPNLYARSGGVSLAALGAVLLAARLFDAFLDPWLGRVCDRLYARSLRAVLAFGAAACFVLGLGFCLLFLPPATDSASLLWWAAMSLLLTYVGYSALAIAHQSWGAMLGGDSLQRSRIVAWREGLGLLGVILAALTPALLGMNAMLGVLIVGLAVGWLAWNSSPRPLAAAIKEPSQQAPSVWQPWRNLAFKKLLSVFMLNGIASAIPATLVLFFVQDRLQSGAAMQSAFLGTYFAFAALSMPMWLQMVKRWGLHRAWLMGMLLAIVTFLGATQLGAGDEWLFLLVCALSGTALGSDLALPGALLAGVIADAGHSGQTEGVYFGWWNFATKLNLALAAGLALPLLGWLGYAPGAQDEASLQILTAAYCLLPCILKAGAAGVLYLFFIHPKASAL
jgi:GPH family glycoside/pentoside/hexuronide:cation symporter